MKTALLNNIEAKITGRREVIPSPFANITFKAEFLDDVFTVDMGTEYRIDISLGASQIISDEDLKHRPEIIDFAKRRIGRGIADHVYGDVKKRLLELAITMRKEGYQPYGESYTLLNDIMEMIEYD